MVLNLGALGIGRGAEEGRDIDALIYYINSDAIIAIIYNNQLY